MTSVNTFKYLVIGGGITGVSVVEKIRSLDETGSILMITESDVIQAASKINRITMNLEDFTIVEKSFETFKDVDNILVIVKDSVINLNADQHIVQTKSRIWYKYQFLCICSGASPHVVNFQQIDGYDFADHIVGIRDTASVAQITRILSQSKKILVVGNGGIATEFVYEAKNVDVIWAIKDTSIAAPYFDNGAACFLLASNQFAESCKHSQQSRINADEKLVVSKRLRYTAEGNLREEAEPTRLGSALGPDWHNDFVLHGLSGGKTVDIQYSTEIRQLFSPDLHYNLIASEFGEEDAKESSKWQTYVELTNGKRFGVDWILSATGVVPNTDWFPGLKDPDRGIRVNDWMHSSLPDVYAAGDGNYNSDICFCDTECETRLTNVQIEFQCVFPVGQMSLIGFKCASGVKGGRWDFVLEVLCVQRLMIPTVIIGGRLCNFVENKIDYMVCFRAKRTPFPDELLTSTPLEQTRNEMFGGFDIFTHITRFFGFKVVLLGRYNGQGIPKEEQRIELRYTPHEEYIKVIVSGDRVQGAVLIGDTGLEETFENMILCSLDISKLGSASLLDPNIDLEDYFD